MKIVVLKFVLVFLCLTSCSNNNDNNSEQGFSIVGEWKITQRTVNDEVQQIGECELFSIFRYNADGSYYEKHYAADIGTPCLENQFFEVNGNWSKEDDDTYVTETDQGTSVFKIDFINENNHKLEDEIATDDGIVIATIIEYFSRE